MINSSDVLSVFFGESTKVMGEIPIMSRVGTPMGKVLEDESDNDYDCHIEDSSETSWCLDEEGFDSDSESESEDESEVE